MKNLSFNSASECVVNASCQCANSSLVRELVNVTFDGLGCYACEPHRPAACTEASDQCTPEACECANPYTHVKLFATTVDGTPCHYCEPIGGVYRGFGSSELMIAVTVISILIIWQLLCRKPAPGARSGNLRLARRQGDRSRAIRIHHEPLKWYEEIFYTFGDIFDAVVDAFLEILGGAWAIVCYVASLAAFAVGWLLNLVDVSLGSTFSLLKQAFESCLQAVVYAASCSCCTRQRRTRAPPKGQKQTPSAAPPPAAPKASVSVASKPSSTNDPAKATSGLKQRKPQPAATKASASSKQQVKPSAAAQPAVCTPLVLPPASIVTSQTNQVKQFSRESSTTSVKDRAVSSASSPLQRRFSDPERLATSSPVCRAMLEVFNIEGADIQSKPHIREDFDERSTADGADSTSSVPTADREDPDAGHESGQSTIRANTAAMAAAVLAAASDRRAAALQLLDAAAVNTIEIRTFITEAREEGPVLRRTVSDSDIALYG